MALPAKKRINYVILNSGYKWDPTLSNQQHREELMAYFQPDPNVKKSVIRNVLEDCFNHKPDRFLRTSEERAKAQELTQKMQAFFAGILPDRAEADYKYFESHPQRDEIFLRLSRSARFALHLGDSDEAKQFNERLIDATLQYKTNPDLLRNLLMDEINTLRENLGLNDPENIRKLHTASDAELVDLYPKYDRFIHLLAELAEGGGKDLFTPEQHAELMKHQDILSLNTTLEHRINLIANPYYADINTELVFAQNLNSSVAQEAAQKYLDLDPDSALGHHLSAIFSEAKSLHDVGPVSLIYSLPIVNPALAGAFQSDAEITPYLMTGSPVVAVGNDGVEYVIQNKPRMDKIPTADEYTSQLIEQALKADKWLLTGSKQFADMLEAMQLMKVAENEHANPTAMKEMAIRAERLAREYLQYKDPDFTEYTGPSSVHGKNMREQSRLEVAGAILNYAKARGPAQDKVKAYNVAKQAKEAAKKAEKEPKPERATHTLEKKEVDVISAKGKEVFMDNLSYNINKVVGRKVPDMKVAVKDKEGKDITVNKTVMSQDEFNSLCAMIAGSPKAYYRRPKKDPNNANHGRAKLESETFMNENPEKTHQDMMMAIYGSYELDMLPQELRFMLTSAMSIGHRAVQNGSFETLGQMLADGLKRNNAVMQEQKQFTPEFYICAKMTADVLNIMERPDLKGLKDVIEANMTKEDLEIANACRGVHNVIADGMKARDRLAVRFKMEDESIAFNKNAVSANDKGILDDMAKLCHMYGMEMQFASNNLKLDNCNYAKFPTFADRLNIQLARTPNINDFVDQVQAMPKEQRVNAINNPQEMAKLFQDGMIAVRNMAVQQPQQPQAQITFTLAAAQPKPEQGLNVPS